MNSDYIIEQMLEEKGEVVFHVDKDDLIFDFKIKKNGNNYEIHGTIYLYDYDMEGYDIYDTMWDTRFIYDLKTVYEKIERYVEEYKVE